MTACTNMANSPSSIDACKSEFHCNCGCLLDVHTQCACAGFGHQCASEVFAVIILCLTLFLLLSSIYKSIVICAYSSVNMPCYCCCFWEFRLLFSLPGFSPSWHLSAFSVSANLGELTLRPKGCGCQAMMSTEARHISDLFLTKESSF